ncbi:MAG: carbon storage regulator [Planctomycetales bacterium]|nr:carbon storage regulator [Planctomycetales bacterium]
MLVLTRKLKEEIRIGNDITITILKVRGNAVRVGIEAPQNVHIVRGELQINDPGEGEGLGELLGGKQDAAEQLTLPGRDANASAGTNGASCEQDSPHCTSVPSCVRSEVRSSPLSSISRNVLRATSERCERLA